MAVALHNSVTYLQGLGLVKERCGLQAAIFSNRQSVRVLLARGLALDLPALACNLQQAALEVFRPVIAAVHFSACGLQGGRCKSHVLPSLVH